MGRGQCQHNNCSHECGHNGFYPLLIDLFLLAISVLRDIYLWSLASLVVPKFLCGVLKETSENKLEVY